MAPPTMLTLETPSEARRAAFIELATEFAAHGDERYTRFANDFDAYLVRARERAAGLDRDVGRVADTQLWLVRDGRILGSSRLRDGLTQELLHEGGHIGYDIRPSERGNGLGTTLLRLTLERAAMLGIGRVRITCDTDNLGSRRIIEHNGGVLDGEAVSVRTGKPIRQYWVTVLPPP